MSKKEYKSEVWYSNWARHETLLHYLDTINQSPEGASWSQVSHHQIYVMEKQMKEVI